MFIRRWEKSSGNTEGERMPQSPKSKAGGFSRILLGARSNSDRYQFDAQSDAGKAVPEYSVGKSKEGEKVESPRDKSRELGLPENQLKEPEKIRELLDNNKLLEEKNQELLDDNRLLKEKNQELLDVNKLLEEKNQELLDDNRLLKEEAQKQQDENKCLREEVEKLQNNNKKVQMGIDGLKQTVERLRKLCLGNHYLSNGLDKMLQDLSTIQEKLKNVFTPDHSEPSTSEEIQRANSSD
jgi:hypothetical protein